jgi:hypothetical protein
MTLARLATLATGLVQMIQQALIFPAAMSSNRAMVPFPVSVRRVPGDAPCLLHKGAVIGAGGGALTRQAGPI